MYPPSPEKEFRERVAKEKEEARSKLKDANFKDDDSENEKLWI